jgi:sarcosine oxidase
MAWVAPRDPTLFQPGRLPVWAIDQGDGSVHYGFPMHPDAPGFKLAHHAPGLPTDPDAVARLPQPGDEQTFRPALSRFLPDADGPLLALRVCLYTNSPDHHFIIDRHPRHDRVVVACGFSGHGFKFASVVGEVLADLAADGRTDLPVGFLGLGRFGT